MVTAELAAALPVLVVLLAVALTAVSVVAARVRAQDAAREAARAAARGDPAAGARLARESAPGSTVVLGRGAGGVTAVVLYKVVRSPAVSSALSSIVQSALHAI